MPAFAPDQLIFVISQPYLSKRRERLVSEGLCQASSVPARCVRLEGTGPSLPQSLDVAVAAGATRILVQPVGLPFSESISSWLPGALAHWLAGAPEGVALRLGLDIALTGEIFAAVADSATDQVDDAIVVELVRPSLGPRGWDHAGEAHDHIFVCTGQRCHFRDAPRLRMLLHEELRRSDSLERYQVTESNCLGPCNLGPLVAHYPEGRWYRLDSREDVRVFVDTVLVQGEQAAHLQVHKLKSKAAAKAGA